MSTGEPERRFSSAGAIGPYGQRYSWAYWAAVAGAAVLLLIDILGDGAEWTNVGAIALIGIAVLLRPGGIRGPR